jgi:6-phosphofructokinase 1
VLKNIETLGLDCVVAIGGDDTLSYAAELYRHGVKVIAVPKTMDNDVRNTEYCIGFSTAITRAMDAIERQRTTVGSHERIGIFRVFGRDAGYTALYTAFVTSVRCCITEYKVNLEHLIEILVTDKRDNPSNYSLVILSEGAEWEGYLVKEYGPADAFGHRKKMSVAEDLSDEIKIATGNETVVSDLTYDLRSGSADFVDRMVASTFAGMAMDSLEAGRTGLMTAISSGCYAMVPIIGDPYDDVWDALRYALYSHHDPEKKPLEMRVQDRLSLILQGDEQKGIPSDPTMAVVQYQRIMREEQEEDEPGYYGGGARRRLRQMQRRRGRR